mmetsp:Transcript_139296/g.313229  ORF Transcript_139296/g.313229 Transcript_139296/m.313229 type:complete len:254 (-) Transcript_139296:111-872(-)
MLELVLLTVACLGVKQVWVNIHSQFRGVKELVAVIGVWILTCVVVGIEDTRGPMHFSQCVVFTIAIAARSFLCLGVLFVVIWHADRHPAEFVWGSGEAARHMEGVLGDAVCRRFFSAFLAGEEDSSKAEVAMAFWLALESLDHPDLPLRTRSEMWGAIVTEYLGPRSDVLVHVISDQESLDLVNRMIQTTPTVEPTEFYPPPAQISVVQEAVANFLIDGLWPRFCASDAYRRLQTELRMQDLLYQRLHAADML